MWLFTSKGFVSVVQDLDNNDNLLVRARIRDHLHTLFPQAVIAETPSADYRYRVNVKKRIVARLVADQVSAINYPNFKGAIVDPDYHAACQKVWGVMYGLQTAGDRKNWVWSSPEAGRA